MSNRINLGRFHEVIEVPNFIEIQINSYNDFLQLDKPPEKRAISGLEGVFRGSFPIESYDGHCRLEYVSYRMTKPRFSEMFCLREGTTYSASLYVTLRLIDDGIDRTEEVLFGEMPLMTDRGSFIINGAERVVVNQLHRTAGVNFEGEEHVSGKQLFAARIIPNRGTWIEMQLDPYDVVYVYLDRRRRRRKFLATTFLRAMGYSSDSDILQLFYDVKVHQTKDLKALEDLSNFLLADDVVDAKQGIVLARMYETLTATSLQNFEQANVCAVRLVDISRDKGLLMRTLKKDTTHNTEEALYEFFMRLRPGEPPTITNAQALLKRLFRDARRYDLDRVGRYKINQKLSLKRSIDDRLVT
ncbi:MAG: DNA-directed RNA polymerase subunit beta, partial [Puniceicoccales bacterium]|nr:DNA-directed RNA polymerase subunit beta [Puniceicoccales bacterium]